VGEFEAPVVAVVTPLAWVALCRPALHEELQRILSRVDGMLAAGTAEADVEEELVDDFIEILEALLWPFGGRTT
jgi:hypothetical protein